MKIFKQTTSIILAAIVILLSLSTPIFAQTSSTVKQQETQKSLDALFYGTNIKNAPELNSIPDEIGGDILTDIIPGIIKLALQLGGVATFAVATYAGIMMIGSRGNEDGTKKAKDTLVFAIIGIIVISAAYAVITGITSFKF
ncbi:hypothetical protein KKG71_05615 [Patescibacteria group bacterium]|nr:hypothetical protein [Patescibacteria group bacterium]